MKNHPVKIFYESLTSIVAPCMTKPQHVHVNATMFDRYLPFSCPLNTFVTDAVRFAPFHHH